MKSRTTDSAEKKEYSKPKLLIYGEFTNLTAGGTGSVVEGMLMTANMRRA